MRRRTPHLSLATGRVVFGRAWLAGLILLAIGSAAYAQPGTNRPTPEQLLEREIELPSQGNEIATSSFSVTAPAALLGSPLWLESGWAMKLDIGTRVPVLCTVHDEALDLGALLDFQIDRMHQEALEQSGSHGQADRLQRRLADIDAGAVAGHPYLAAEWLLIGGDDESGGDSNELDGPRLPLSMTKHRVAEVDGHTVSCGHHEVGYRGTFRDLFERFVASLTPRNPQVDETVLYEEIQAVRMNGLRVGLVRTTLRQGSDQEAGSLWLHEASSSYLPAQGGGAARARDTLKLSLVTAAGELVRATLLERGDGIYKLDLQKIDGIWTLSERRNSQETTSQLGNVPLGSFLSWANRIAASLASDQRPALYAEEWQPLTNPRRFTRRKLEWQPGAAAGEALVSEGAVTGRAWFDANGSSRRAVVSHQGISVELERVVQRGSLP